jgi:hypothetical protein
MKIIFRALRLRKNGLFSCEAELSTDDLHIRLRPVAGIGAD